MPTYTDITYHLVFATKNRERVLNKENREDLFWFIWGVLKKSFVSPLSYWWCGRPSAYSFFAAPDPSVIKHCKRNQNGKFSVDQRTKNFPSLHILARGIRGVYCRGRRPTSIDFIHSKSITAPCYDQFHR